MAAKLGNEFEDGEIIIRQGDVGDSMFVIQEGEAEVIAHKDGHDVVLAIRGAGDMVGEMAIFEKQVRYADVRAKGRVRVLTVDKKNFLRRINEDPSLAYRLVQTLSRRLRELSEEVAVLKGSDQAP